MRLFTKFLVGQAFFTFLFTFNIYELMFVTIGFWTGFLYLKFYPETTESEVKK